MGLFCKRALLKRRYSAKETYNLIDPTDRSHPILTLQQPTTHTAITHCNMDTDTDTDAYIGKDTDTDTETNVFFFGTHGR